MNLLQGLELAEIESREHAMRIARNPFRAVSDPLKVDCGLAKAERCATIGAGIESNAINGGESSLRLLIDYAGIANRLLFDLALFDLVGSRGIVRD